LRENEFDKDVRKKKRVFERNAALARGKKDSVGLSMTTVLLSKNVSTVLAGGQGTRLPLDVLPVRGLT